MPGRVTLLVTAGPMRGRRFEFTSHDTFLFGRSPDCHAELDPGDTSASRHHFLLEVNPPAARLRDLGSLNGTHVNGIRCGGREKDETPEQGARRQHPQIDLKDRDQIRVGATVISVAIEAPSDLQAPATLRSAGLEPGRALGDYVIEALLGEGGMGAVYRARRRGDGVPVALKLLLPQVVVDPEAREIFLREIDVTRSLRHPNIVALLDFGTTEEAFFFAMEYCPGGNAEALMIRAGGRLDLETALRLGLECLEGLAFAHASGFVHRDIKPDNLLLGEDGTGKVADFGLAKSFQQAGLSGLTATGAVGGTPYFMPREQITNFRQAKPASDVWSMGATLYHLLTGEHAREFAPDRDPLAVILHGGVVPIRRRDPDVPEALARVIDRALADDASERYADAGDFRDALRGIL